MCRSRKGFRCIIGRIYGRSWLGGLCGRLFGVHEMSISILREGVKRVDLPAGRQGLLRPAKRTLAMTANAMELESMLEIRCCRSWLRCRGQSIRVCRCMIFLQLLLAFGVSHLACL